MSTQKTIKNNTNKARKKIEFIIISHLLQSPEAIEKAIGANLRVEDFSFPTYATYYEIIQNQYLNKHNTPTINLILSQLKIEEENLLEKHEEHLQQVLKLNEPIENFTTYLDKLKEENLKIDFLRELEDLKIRVLKGEESNILLGEALDIFMEMQNLGGSNRISITLKEGMEETLKQMKVSKEEKLVATGYYDLDKRLNGGFRMSTLNFIIGRPSNGKSTLSLNIALNAAYKYKIPIVYASLEMPYEQIVMRVWATLSTIIREVEEIPLWKLKKKKFLSDEDWESLAYIIQVADEIPFYIEDLQNCTISEYYAMVNAHKRMNNVYAFFADYYQLFKKADGSAPEKESEFAAISEGLRSLARQTETCQIAVAQVSRKPDSRPLDKRAPMISDMRNSGKAEQDAEVILGVFREEFYTKEESERPNEIDVLVLKNRDGEVGTHTLFFNGDFVTIENLAPDREESPNFQDSKNESNLLNQHQKESQVKSTTIEFEASIN
ncbi:MAG: replicative DNA helicase [bacterium]